MTISDPFLKDIKSRIYSSLYPVNFGEPKLTRNIAERLLKEFDGEPEPPKSIDLENLTNKVKRENSPSIDRKEIKLMPWILFHGETPRLIEIPKKSNYIFKTLNDSFRLRYLKDLIYVYLYNYDPSIKGCESIRKFIWDKLEVLKNKQTKNYRVRLWINNQTPILLPNGHHQTADVLLKKEGEINKLLTEYGFDQGLSTSKFIKSVSFLMIELTKKKFPTNLTKCLSINEIPDNPPKAKFKDMIVKMASDFLQVAGIDAEVEIKENLSSFFLRHLKDPRIPGNEIHWRGVEVKGKEVFCQWLSSKDLEFFFNIVDETSSDTNWEYRRKFWEAYLPHIENTWVILGRQARQKAAQAKSSKFHFETNRYGHLESGSQKHSVFLIEMGGYVFVEWNDSGACRIFKIGKCPFKLYKPSYHADELRARNHQLRVIHNSPHTYNWQERLRRWIRDNTHPTIFIDGNDYKLDN